MHDTLNRAMPFGYRGQRRKDAVGDAGGDDFDAWVVAPAGQVFRFATAEVIDHHDPAALDYQTVYGMRADKTSATSH
jgi:hypothetical protein